MPFLDSGNEIGFGVRVLSKMQRALGKTDEPWSQYNETEGKPAKTWAACRQRQGEGPSCGLQEEHGGARVLGLGGGTENLHFRVLGEKRAGDALLRPGEELANRLLASPAPPGECVPRAFLSTHGGSETSW